RGGRVRGLARRRFPRAAPCGGGIGHGAHRRFPDLAAHLRAKVAIHEIRRVLMESPGGHSVVASGDGPFYLTLRRTELDAALLERARAEGARVEQAVRVTGLEHVAGGLVV